MSCVGVTVLDSLSVSDAFGAEPDPCGDGGWLGFAGFGAGLSFGPLGEDVRTGPVHQLQDEPAVRGRHAQETHDPLKEPQLVDLRVIRPIPACALRRERPHGGHNRGSAAVRSRVTYSRTIRQPVRLPGRPAFERR